MKYRIHHTVLFICLWLVFTGDSWMMPEKRTIKSENGNYEFTIIPKNYGGMLVCSARESCYGYFLSKITGKYLWRYGLPYGLSPVFVKVANSGKRVVTIDEWGKMGYGDNVVVVYGSEGQIIKRYTLEQILSPLQIYSVMHTVSSIWWYRDSHFENNDSILAVSIDVVDTTRTDIVKVKLY